MEPYISKSAVMAELNRLIAELVEEGEDTMFEQGRISAFEDIKVFINHTLEVEEVNVEKEFDAYIEKQNAFINDDNSEIKYYNGDSFSHTYDIRPIAKHFFELGLNARKE